MDAKSQEPPESHEGFDTTPVSLSSSSSATPASEAKLIPGTPLSDTYILERLLGKGGMGEVWLAKHQMLDELRAIKFMLDSYAENSTSYARFVQSEAKNTMRLNHPNIVRVYELSRYQDMPYIVMEYIQSGAHGSDLRDLIKRQGKLSLEQASDILDQLAAALMAAHQAGLVHRDIKPANILLTAQGQVKLTDFGIAKDLEADTHLTRSGQGIGTPVYLSPEQAKGKAEPRSDQYSVGIVLFEMITGRPPFLGDFPTLLMQHAFASPPTLRDFVSSIPNEVEAVIYQALSKRPEDRFFDMLALAHAFRNAVADGISRAFFPTTTIDPSSLPSMPSNIPGMEMVDISVLGTTPVPFTPGTSSLPRVSAPLPPFPMQPAPPVSPITPTNLPTDLADIIGRAKETQEVIDLLRESKVRLITLTGAGGTGKTRLSLQVASDLLPEFKDGVFLVSLENIDDSSQVVTAISQALKVKEVAGQTPLQTLKDYLKNKQMLLVLDNFEQVVKAAKTIAEILKETNYLKMLVTSRIALKVSAEQIFPVPTLRVPDITARLTSEELSQFAAVELFIQRARRSDPSFNITNDNASAVAEICARLDGLPLAIELAAARVESLTPQEILSRLGLKLLSSSIEDVSERQRTLRKTIDWSYDLLEEEEQTLFNRLGIFRSGCKLKAAESICDPANEMEVEVLDGIAALINRSLVQKREDSDSTARYVMLQTIREYAQEKLKKSGEQESLRQRFTKYFLKDTEQTAAKLGGAGIEAALKSLEAEHGNLRTVLDWSIEKEEQETALQMVGSLGQFWMIRCYWSEGRSYFDRAIALAEEAKPVTLAKALNVSSALANSQGDYAKALEMLERALSIYRQAEDKAGIAKVLNNLAQLNDKQGNYALAKTQLQESLTLAYEIGLKPVIGTLLNSLGIMTRREEDYSQAQSWYEQALSIYREIGDKFNTVHASNNLGNIHNHIGNYAQAETYYLQGLEISQALGDKRGIALALLNLGNCYHNRNDDYYALNYKLESLRLSYEIGNKNFIAYNLEGLALLAVSAEQWERAAHLFGAAETLRKALSILLQLFEQQEHDREVAYLHTRLDEAAFNVAWQTGALMPLEEAVSYALQQ